MNIGHVADSNPKPVPLNKGFLQNIALLTPEERSVLSSLAADSPPALWAMIEASAEPFVRILGLARTRELSAALWHLIPSNERQILQNPQFTPPPLGVPIGDERPVSPSATRYDIARRDQLHKELQQLRGQSSPDAKRNVEYLEHELRTLLKGNGNSY